MNNQTINNNNNNATNNMIQQQIPFNRQVQPQKTNINDIIKAVEDKLKVFIFGKKIERK